MFGRTISEVLHICLTAGLCVYRNRRLLSYVEIQLSAYMTNQTDISLRSVLQTQYFSSNCRDLRNCCRLRRDDIPSGVYL
jgi:hypothetical protein